MANQKKLIRNFIKSNISIILSKEDQSQLIKRNRAQFYSRYNVSSGDMFDHKKIALETAGYLMEIGKIRTLEQLHELFEAYYIKKYLKTVDKNYLENKLKSDEMISIDFSDLSHRDYLAKIEKEYGKKVKSKIEKELGEEKRQIEKLKKQVEQDLASLEKLRSELDDLPSEPDIENMIEKKIIEPEEDNKEEGLFWWERLGLEDNPFPTTHGLYRIPEEKYDDIVVMTKTVSDYANMFTRTPEAVFGTTILLSGQFGSGKTTIFQYISHILSQSKVYPILSILEPKNDWELIQNQLYSDIYDKISEALKGRGYADPRSEGYAVDRSTVAKAIKALCEKYSCNGVILFIDGLHKGDKTVKSSLEFVKQLQNLHEYFETKALNVGIVIASSPLWLRTVTKDPSYSGSYHQIHTIPPITFDDAFELLQSRIKSYRKSDDIPIFFDKSTIEFAFSHICSDIGEDITFRDFIDYVLPRLQKGEFEEAGISVAIDMGAFNKISAYMNESSISDQYKKFCKITADKPDVRTACSKILIYMYENRSITERDEVFKKNRGALWVLRKSDLIEKVIKSGKGESSFGWAISRDMLLALDELNKVGIPPKVVFKSFGIDPARRKILMERRKDDITRKAEEIIDTWGSEWPDITPNIESFLKIHKKIKTGFSLSEQDLSEYCKKSLSNLILAVQKASETSFEEEEWARKTWLDIPAPEAIETVFLEQRIKRDERTLFLQNYSQGADIILNSLIYLLKASRIVNISSLKVGFKEKRLIQKAAYEFEYGALEGAIDTIADTLEKAIRSSFNIALSLHGGGDATTKLPDGLKRSIKRKKEKGYHLLKTTPKENPLYHLSRGEYSEIMQFNQNWDLIFKPAFGNKNKKEVIEAIRTIFAIDTRSHHRDDPSYFRKVREQIRSSIIYVSWLLEGISKLYDLSILSPGFKKQLDGDTVIFTVSFIGESELNNSKEIIFSKSAGQKVFEKLIKHTEIDLSNEGDIISRYNISPTIMCVLINYCIKEQKITYEKLSDSSSHYKIVSKNGK